MSLDTQDIEKISGTLRDADLDKFRAFDPFEVNGWTMLYDDMSQKPEMACKDIICSYVNKHHYIVPDQCWYKFRMIDRWFGKVQEIDGALVRYPDEQELKSRKCVSRTLVLIVY